MIVNTLKRKHLVIVMVLCVLPAGCVDIMEEMKSAMGFVDEARVHIEKQKGTLAFMEGQLQELDLKLLSMKDGPEKDQTLLLRNRLAEGIQNAEAVLTELELSLLTVQEAVLSAEFPEDVVIPISKRVGTFLPPPWDVLITLVVGTVATAITGYRAAKAKRAAKEVVVAIENAKVDDVVRMSTVKMGLNGKKLVDDVQAVTVVRK